tara:strand:- start:1164 stop:1310 length:147 start_codon:yes stop_codon:yes gene_type:complete
MAGLAIGSLHITFKDADIKPILMTVGEPRPKKVKAPYVSPVIKVREVS